ncbi:MAG: preprotein translocase subunit SecY [Verrucomicrobiales bacterium]
MISAFANTLKIPELRQRIMFTLAMIFIVRIGCAIVLPGVDASVLREAFQNTGEQANPLMALMNVFSGGGLTNCAVFALGIMPYISASIMMQLLTAVVPKLSKLAREDGGRQKINMYTRYAAILLCVFQSGLLAKSLDNNGASNVFLAPFQPAIEATGRALVPNFGTGFVLLSILVITGGTMLLMWIGEQVTERGIGNGISLIISVNIVSALPGALASLWNNYVGNVGTDDPMKPIKLVFLIFMLILVIAGVIAITQAQRRIAIQYAKRMKGRKMYGGQTTYLPLKVNYAGVMPIIFAQAILIFPTQFLGMAFGTADWFPKVQNLLSPAGWLYYVISALLIFFFSYFWVATMFQPNQIAEDLKKNGGYIPGVRPGKPTATFLDYTMSRLTFAGAIFLTVIAVLPPLVSTILNVPPLMAQFFGGTSILILVGVILDVMRQAETHLLQRHYDGFLRKGRIRGRGDRRAGGGATASSSVMLYLMIVLALIIIVGMSYYVMKKGG